MLSRRFVTFLFFLFDKLKFPRHTTILYHAKLALETFYIYICMYYYVIEYYAKVKIVERYNNIVA